MPSYSLSILRHDQSSDLFTFDQAKVLIGRESGDVVTRDPKTSGRHGELTFEGGVLRFTDLNSTNGTYRVSGERVVGTIVLTPGTALRIGDTTIAVQAIDSGLGFGPGGTQVMQAPPAAAFADTALATAPAALGQLAPEAPAPPAPGPVAAAPQGAPAPAPQPAPAAAWSGQAASDAFGGAPAAGAPVGQPSPAPSPHPLAAPAPAYAAPPLAGSGDGLFDQFKAFLSNAVETYKTQAVDGALTMGLVMLPGAVVGVATGWIPIVGWILGVLVALVELAMAPIAAGAMWRWSLAAASGERLTWKQAWGAALKSPVSEWLNIAVMSFVIAVGSMFLLIPGLLVGMFAGPAYLLEKKTFFGANMRSLELVLKDPGRHLGLALLVLVTVIPVMIVTTIATVILNFVPFIGAAAAQLISVTVLTLLVPFVSLLWASIYFDARQRAEREDAKALYAPIIRSWGNR